MNVVIIGSGNVATVMGKLMKEKGHCILQIVSRSIIHEKKLANLLHIQATDEISKINTGADLYLLAVADDKIIEVANKMSLPGKIVVHTSGAVSKKILKNVSQHHGVIYPLQSLRREANYQPLIPLLVDGSNKKVKKEIIAFAKSLSEIVLEANDTKRLKLHAGAVIVSNFTNHLYALTEKFCKEENINFSMLTPLIIEVATRTADYPPSQMQTGPAIRGDVQTIKKHLHTLKNYPHLQKIYKLMSESIIQLSAESNENN